MELILKAGLTCTKPVITPVDKNTNLTSIQNDELTQYKHNPREDPPSDQGAFQRLIKMLLYLTITTLDISFSVQNIDLVLTISKNVTYRVCFKDCEIC